MRKVRGNLRNIFCNDTFPNDPISGLLIEMFHWLFFHSFAPVISNTIVSIIFTTPDPPFLFVCKQSRNPPKKTWVSICQTPKPEMEERAAPSASRGRGVRPRAHLIHSQPGRGPPRWITSQQTSSTSTSHQTCSTSVICSGGVGFSQWCGTPCPGQSLTSRQSCTVC